MQILASLDELDFEFRPKHAPVRSYADEYSHKARRSVISYHNSYPRPSLPSSNTPLLLPSLLLPKTKRPNPLPPPPHLPFRLHKRLDPHHRRVGASDRGRGHVDAAGFERVDEDVEVVGGGAVVA